MTAAHFAVRALCRHIERPEKLNRRVPQVYELVSRSERHAIRHACYAFYRDAEFEERIV